MNYKQLAEDLIKALKSTSYVVDGGVAEGLSVMVWQDAEKVSFDHNLGGFNVPTKAEAREMLGKLLRHYKELCAASVELVAYFEGKVVEVCLIVFSGQMDFIVAKMVEGEITWFSNLV